MKTKKTAVFLTLGLILLIAVAVAGFFLVREIYYKNQLKNELERVLVLSRSDGVKTDELKELCDTTVSVEKYVPVEKAVKQYLADYRVTLDTVQEVLNDVSLNTLLDSENLSKDGPMFNTSREAVYNAKKILTDNRSTLAAMMTENGALGIYSYTFDDEYDDLFLKYTVETSENIENVRKQNLALIDGMGVYLDTCIKVFDHLADYPKAWEIKDGTIYFHDDAVMEKYNKLIENI